jgi:hypothetical protein
MGFLLTTVVEFNINLKQEDSSHQQTEINFHEET